MTSWITICDTCRRDGWATPAAGATDGEKLAAEVETRLGDAPGLRMRRVSCLMGCTHACNVALQAPGKIAYTLGDFTPDGDAAQAIVDYARLYAASPRGLVAWRDWPDGVRDHFITRHMPLPENDT